MAKETNGIAEMTGLGDLGVIRNILMGEQVAKIDAHLASQNAEITDLKQVMADSEKAIKTIIAQLDAKIQSRLDQLEQRVAQNDQAQKDELKATISAERKSLSTMLRTVSEQLIK
jgi:uncharacterized coiled-coil protein SlyX